jgi:hypothetical protein
MRNAKDPDPPPGGYTRVNGQDQWEKRAMTAHCAVTASANPRQKSVVFSDDEYDLCSETEEFLANFVWEYLSTNYKAYLEPDGDPNSSSARMACNDGYLPEDGEPVQIMAQMVTDDLLFDSGTNSTTPKISAALERSESSSVSNVPSMPILIATRRGSIERVTSRIISATTPLQHPCGAHCPARRP